MPGPPTPWEDFTSPAYKLNVTNASSSRMINIYPELLEKGPRAGKYRLRRIPGMRTFCIFPDGPVRGMIAADSGNSLYVVSGSTVYQVFADGTFQAQTGEVPLNNHPVTMAENGFTIAIAAAGFLYMLHGGAPGTVTPQLFTDGTPVRAATVDFIDNYFVADQVDSKQVFISNLAPAGDVWDPGDTAFKEGYPDNISRVFCDNEVLWLLGFDTTEPWSDNGGLFPFGRINDLVIKIGCSAPYSVAGIAGYRFWLWKGAIYGCQGLNPEPISDLGVEEAIATYGDVSNAEAWCMLQGKKILYCITFPTVKKTWVYDLNAKAWHERGLWIDGAYEMYHARVYANAFNKDLVGDPVGGILYQLDENYHYDIIGGPLRWERITPYLTDNMNLIRMNSLTVDMDTGVGLNVAPNQPGYDPQVILKYSNNRGKNWSYERSASMGKIGENDIRVIFNQLGSSRIGWVVDLYGSDPVPTSINTAYVDTGGRVKGR